MSDDFLGVLLLTDNFFCFDCNSDHIDVKPDNPKYAYLLPTVVGT